MRNLVLGGRRAWLAMLLSVATVFFPMIAAVGEASATTPAAVEPPEEETGLDPSEQGLDLGPREQASELDRQRFTRSLERVDLPPIPDKPVASLVAATNAHSAYLGYPNVDHGPAIRESGMSAELAGRTAQLMQAARACPALAQAEQTVVTKEQRGCAAKVNDLAAGVSQAAEKESFDNIQAWPALYVDGDGSDDHYDHDYSVLIDTGGNDTYDNNAGGNLLDTLHGPEGSAAPSNKPAIGCEHPHIVPGIPGTIAAPYDCIADRQTVLVDKEGDATPTACSRGPRNATAALCHPISTGWWTVTAPTTQ